MTINEIPLSGKSQSFQVVVLNVTYVFTVIWRDAASEWVLDIADVNSNPLVQGLPLVTGCDLLGQYAYLGLGFQLWVATDGDPDAVPIYANLGTQSHLYVVTP
jgi:predicted Zn-dependent protease with MMP-like domain